MLKWVVMRPVNRSTFFVPLVFAEKCDFIANRERDNSRCQVNIMGNQECLARFECNDKSLMPTSVSIIREEPTDGSRSLHLKIALVLRKGMGQTLVTFANSYLAIDHRRRRARAKGGETDNHCKQTEFHRVSEIPRFIVKEAVIISTKLQRCSPTSRWGTLKQRS